jgi:6-phosphofructokinase 1
VVEGKSGFMVKLVRAQGTAYSCATALQPLADIANVEHMLPRDWISDDGFMPNDKFVQYARPLIEGEVQVPTENGLPKFAVLKKTLIPQTLPPRK